MRDVAGAEARFLPVGRVPQGRRRLTALAGYRRPAATLMRRAGMTYMVLIRGNAILESRGAEGIVESRALLSPARAQGEKP